MNDAGSVLLSVRAEARQLVAPDYAVVDGLIEHTAASKQEAVRPASASVDRLTTDLAALGAVAFDASGQRPPLTWSAHSLATEVERYHDKETGRLEGTGQVTATVALRVTVRDLDTLDAVSSVLAADQSLSVHAVTWHVDWDNPAWPQVRAAAIQAAIHKGRDYAAALGGGPWVCEDFAGEREALEAVARALDERRGLVLARARYDRQADENGVIINLASVVSVRVSKTDSAAAGQYL